MNTIVLTTYLTSKPDPQRGITWKPNDDKVVATWIESLTRCGLHGIIFHDNLSEEFAEKWGSANVRFQQVAWHTKWTAAEERVMIYARWLLENKYDKVLTTDLADLEFYRDPFDLMTYPDKLYIGSEPAQIGNILWMVNRMNETYGEVTNPDKPILNPGVCGGNYNTVAMFLLDWLDEMRKAVSPIPPPPHDICAFNRVLYRGKIPYVTGPPLHTKFRGIEGPESGCYIRHK